MLLTSACHWREEGKQGQGADPHAAHRQSTLAVATVKGLGRVVTDAGGFVLYRFEKDTADPPASTCDGDCAQAWPPVLSAENPTFKDIDRGLVGTVRRAEGAEQLTLDGWPLYRYRNDKTPGQPTGQGMDEAWFVVDPEGQKANGGIVSDGYGS